MADEDTTRALLDRMKLSRQIDSLRTQYDQAPDSWSARLVIRKVYALLDPYIHAAADNGGVRAWEDPYALDWLMSPIEWSAWQDIRQTPGVVLYPEYPVDRYFIDFGNPVLKIGLELDGAEFHEPAKDLERDKALYRLDWLIFRVPGKQARRAETPDEYQERMYDSDTSYTANDLEQAKEDYYLRSSEGVVASLGVVFFDRDRDHPDYPLCLRSLAAHCWLGKNLLESPRFKSCSVENRSV